MSKVMTYMNKKSAQRPSCCANAWAVWSQSGLLQCLGSMSNGMLAGLPLYRNLQQSVLGSARTCQCLSACSTMVLSMTDAPSAWTSHRQAPLTSDGP